MLRHHITLMFLYAVATALFFSLLWRRDRRDRIRLFFVISLSLFAGGAVLGWVMFPFPLR